jgi:hypothetical protein
LHQDQNDVIAHADVIVLGTNAVDKKQLLANLRPGQTVIDLVHLDYSHAQSRAAATV